MIAPIATSRPKGALERRPSARADRHPVGAWNVLALSAWCGLAAGWLEVATRILCKSLLGTGWLYMMTRHFVWLIPLSNLLMFVVVGLFLALATRAFPRVFGWLSPRILCAMTIVPALVVAGSRIYPWAWSILACGISLRLVSWLETLACPWRRWRTQGLAVMLSLVVIVAAMIFGGEKFNEIRESTRALPPGDPPNVLLIVLDTVRADRMSLYGYRRPTTPELDKLASTAVNFTEARATAPWTLASHASMFSGRLPHELGVEWVTALRPKFPTLAEELGTRGYATAGFAANIGYCSYDTGLDRGFTHFEDYWVDLEHLRPLRAAVLFQRAWDTIIELARLAGPQRFAPVLAYLVAPYRKDASMVNRQFTRWLFRQRDPQRPFFAFLNYFDTHVPYLPPQPTPLRFGPGPRSLEDFHLLVGQWDTIDKGHLPPHFRELIDDSYDNCLSYLDGQLGKLFATLENRGILDNTVVIITSDHGEELGDHGLSEHGESLFRPEIRVPLLIKMPRASRPAIVVHRPVSLSDLPATIVDLTGLRGQSPFPGRSLRRFWLDSPARNNLAAADIDDVVSELSAPNPTNPSHGRSPAIRGPLISVAEENYVYIRNQRDGREQLYHELDDPGELTNLAPLESMRPRLERYRNRVGRIAAPAEAADR